MSLLGGFELRRRGKVVRLPTRKAEALLAYLALAPQRVHARDALTTLLWGEVSDQSARASLRQTLFLIGKALNRAAIVVEGRSLVLAPGVLQIDVADFERLRANADTEALERAAELYGGDLLAGIVVNEPSFEEWLRGERQRLREGLMAVLSRLMAVYRQTGDADRAIQIALRLVVLEPLEEDAHRMLMRLYMDKGRRAAALQQYQSCVEVLQRELGAEPAAETRTLYREILQSEAAAINAASPEDAVDRFSSSASAEPDATPALTPPIGRAAELSRLCQALDRARQGHGRVAIVVGEAGIGKTTLLSSLAAAAGARGGRVVVGRSYESEQILPFAPWVDAFQTSGALVSEVLDELDPRWRAELTRLFPEVHASGLPTPGDDPRRLFESVLQLLFRLAAVQPLVVLLEDMHWADDMSTRLLSFVGRRLQGHAVLVVATAREEELPDASALRPAVRELRGANQLDEVPLAPLSMADTAILVRSHTRGGADAEVVARLEAQIWRMSEGNPFVAVETLRAFGEGNIPSRSGGSLSLPERVRAVIVHRLERLTPRAQQLAAVAAVIGREHDFQLLAQASGIGEREAADAVEELVRRRILHAIGEGLDFTHDYIRQAAYGRIIAPERTVLHARIATALEALHGADPGLHFAALAQHCEQGGVWAKAVTYLRKAGAQAAERSAYREAARSFERALSLLERLPGAGNVAAKRPPSREWDVESIQLRVMLRNALLPLGEESRILECLQEAERSAKRLDDRGQHARILSYLCRHKLRVNEYPDALDAGGRALKASAATGDMDVTVAANLYLGFVHQFLGDLPNAIDHLRNTLALIEGRELERCGLPYLPSVFARMWLAWCVSEQGNFAEGFANAREAIELAESIDQPWDRLVAYHGMGLVHLGRGDRADAVHFLERAARLCESVDVVGMHANMTGYLGYVLVLTGRPADGVSLLEQAIAVSGAPQSWAQSRLLGFRAEALMLLGRPDQALDSAKRALQIARTRTEKGYEAWALRTLAEVLAVTGAAESAERYRDALRLAQELGMRPLVAHCHQGLGELDQHAGKRRNALQHAIAAATTYRELDMPCWRDRADEMVEQLR